LDAKNFLSLAHQLIFPSQCQLCGEPALLNLPLCNLCLKKVQEIGALRCEVCGKAFTGEVNRLCGSCIKEKPKFDQARAWAKFEEPMVQIIHQFKYQRGFYFANWMIDSLFKLYLQEFSSQKFDLLIPIPLHWKRLLQRGYNQTLILAQPLSKKLKIPLSTTILQKTRNTHPQVRLSSAQRKENLKKSFQLKKPESVEGKNILLIDDVITSGATANEAGKILKQAGANKVCILALART